MDSWLSSIRKRDAEACRPCKVDVWYHFLMIVNYHEIEIIFGSVRDQYSVERDCDCNHSPAKTLIISKVLLILALIYFYVKFSSFKEVSLVWSSKSGLWMEWVLSIIVALGDIYMKFIESYLTVRTNQ
jgi:hypothetical protein